MKKFFKNHFKKCVSFISILCATSLFSISAFALDSWYNVNTPVNAVNLGSGTVMGSVISSDVLDPDEYGWYRFDNVAQQLNAFRIRFYSSSWHLVLSSEYDYYFTILLESNDIANFNLNINSVSIREYEFDANPNYTGYFLRDLIVKNYDGTRLSTDYKGVSITGKYDAAASGNIAQILFNCTGSTLPAGLMASINLFQVPVDTSESDVEKIVNAINTQTHTIDNSIDNQTDIIINGTDDTDSTVSDFDDVFSDFNDKIAEWEEFDDDIIAEWDDANSEYQTQLSDFNLSTSLLKAGNWLSTSMQRVYNDSSDYKMLWLVPLLFGIPILLFVISKGREE